MDMRHMDEGVSCDICGKELTIAEIKTCDEREESNDWCAECRVASYLIRSRERQGK